MEKINLSLIVGNLKKRLIKHSPEILTGIGIAGMIGTVIMAVKATPKALSDIDDEMEYQLQNNDERHPDDYRLTTKQIIIISWKYYVPTAITGILSIGCIISGSIINHKRGVAWATACALSEAALKEYKDKVIETIGEKKEQNIRDEIAKERISKKPVDSAGIIITNNGDTLCYDHHSGRYFKSNIEKLKKSMNELNRRMLSENYISLNDFYYEVGLDNTKLGDDLGWRVDDGLIDLYFSSQLTEDGTPCIVIDY